MGNGGEKVVNGPGMRLGTCGKEVGRPAGAGEGGGQEQKVATGIGMAIYEHEANGKTM